MNEKKKKSELILLAAYEAAGVIVAVGDLFSRDTQNDKDDGACKLFVRDDKAKRVVANGAGRSVATSTTKEVVVAIDTISHGSHANYSRALGG